ncbi:hypothetical protein PV326_012945 [Microctonus aethiopoides]|nr:hypothetical protein PV326_012945 [Microctonus aethiopoides]
MEVKVNQKEYLKKYLGGGDKTEKKKKKLLKLGRKKVKIIDDDIDLNNLRPMEDGEFDIFNSTEDAPQIAGIIDERGPIDFTDKRRWKIIADDGEGNIAISSNNNHHQDNDNHKITSHDRSFSDDDQNLRRKSKKLTDNNSSPPRKSSLKDKKISKKHRRKDSSSSESSSDSSMNSDSTRKRKSNSKKHRRKTEKSKKYDSDLSPPRPSRKHNDNQRESTRHQYPDSDLSPPRPSRKQKNDQRESTRRQEEDSDLSPPRKSSGNMSRNYKRNRGDDSDLSPPRKSQKNSRDENKYYDSNRNKNISRHDRQRSPRHRKSRWADDESRRSQSPHVDRRLKKTLDGKTAGLQDSSSLREEIAAQKKREDDFFYKCSDEMTGVGQATVLRDRKTGRKRNLEAEAVKKREEEKRQEEIVAKYAKWGKGLKQVDDQTEKLQQDLYEMSKPLARYADDKDLDAQLRAVEREGDPMLDYIKQKQIKEGKREPDRPNYQGSFMPNRFGIKPGHRWDGVDRSNGYEKKWFEARNAKAAIQEEAYKWSTADM